jgi:hypothetical protein
VPFAAAVLQAARLGEEFQSLVESIVESRICLCVTLTVVDTITRF